MTIYNYTALKNHKELVNGKIEALDLRDARNKIRELGFVPTNVETEGVSKEIKSKVSIKNMTLSLQEKIDFTSTLQILTQSGIPIIESLLFIENDAAKVKLQVLAQELRTQIMNGATFADTVTKYATQFGQVFVGLCKAGEDSGELEVTLDRLLELLKKQAAIKSKVIGMLVYPVFVICLAVIIILIMLMFVFPIFKEMYDSMEKELPWITAVLMDAGLFLKAHWIYLIITLVAIVMGIIFLFKWKPSRIQIDKIALKIPVFSKLVCFSELSNFIAVMQVAYDAGISIVESLYLANWTVSNYELRKNISLAATKVQQGQHLSVALKSTGVIPKMILFMISTGEQSGRLGDMLLQATAYIDKMLDDVVNVMTKLIEPVMLVVIGGIVLVLALALYLPLFGSYMN